MSMDHFDIRQFVKERDEALLSMDREKMLAYCRKYGISIAPDEKVFLAGMHQARLGVLDIPEEEQVKSVIWLMQNGFGLPEYADPKIVRKAVDARLGGE